MKKRYIVILLLGLIVYFGLAKTNFIGNQLLSHINSRLNPQQLVITAEEARASFLGLEAKKFVLSFPRFLSSVEFSDLNLSPRWMALLSGKFGADLKALAYAGNVQAGLVTNMQGVSQQLELKISQLNIVQYPLAALLGLASGLLDLDLRMEQLDLPAQRNGRVRFEMHNVVRPKGYSAIPELAKLPDISISQMVVDGNLSANLFKIGSANLESDLGNANGAGDLTLDNAGNLAQLDLRIKFALTQQGLATLGPIFQSRGGVQFAHLEPIFTVRISGSPQNRSVYMVRES